MRRSHAFSSVRDALPMGTSSDILADGAAGSLLHRDPFSGSQLSQCGLLVIGEAQSHWHEAMVSD